MLTYGCQELQIYISVGVFLKVKGRLCIFFLKTSKLYNSWKTADADCLASFKEVIAYLCGIEEPSHLH